MSSTGKLEQAIEASYLDFSLGSLNVLYAAVIFLYFSNFSGSFLFLSGCSSNDNFLYTRLISS